MILVTMLVFAVVAAAPASIAEAGGRRRRRGDGDRAESRAGDSGGGRLIDAFLAG
jgi:hypothetical protein